MSSSPKVLAIGSCRVFRPLRRLHDAGRIVLTNYDANFWFTHSSGAARQYVEVMLGHKEIPMELRRAALESVLEFPGDMDAGIPDVDVAVVEISSLKQHRVDGYFLNAHKIYGMATELGVAPHPVLNGQTDGLPADHLLSRLLVGQTTAAELRDDLVAIRSQVAAPVVAVDHLYSLMSSGEPPAERVKLTEQLRAVSLEEGIGFYSTKDLILECGIDRALLDQNHYRSDFEGTVGERMYPVMERQIVGN